MIPMTPLALREMNAWNSKLGIATINPNSVVMSASEMPLARVRILSLPDGSVLASALTPLPLSSLNDREYTYLMQAVEWPTSASS